MKRTRQEKIRLGVLLVCICLFFGIAAARLIQFQVFLAPKYSGIVQRQSSGKVSIPAERGVIYDRTGRIVANNVTVSSLYAYPTDSRSLKEVSRYLERLFSLEAGTARKKYGLAVKKFRWVKRRLPDELAAKVETSAPAGLYLRKGKRRDYPNGLVGKQILGFTDIDNQGQAGFELAHNSTLAGKPGWADIRRDGLRNILRVNETALVKPVPGASYVLTVDWYLQEIVEEELQKAVEKHNAKSGMAVFLDCHTGDLLAAAHFDPEETYRDRPVKLRPVTDQFEPGSVFKVITAAALLDDGQINFSDSTFCEDGAWRIGRRTLHDDKDRGWLTFREIMELSSNIGIAKHAIELGGEQLVEAAQRFGVGQKQMSGLPGETSGRIARPSRWSDYNVSALAMGHAVTVTSMQMASVFGAIANGGKLHRPRIVLGEVDDEGYVVNHREPVVVGEALSKGAADSLRAFLRGVVERGTADIINSKVIALAGKTGTAQMPDPENKRYFQNRYIGSFGGFFPYENPAVAGIVVIEDPQPIHYGGHTAGPVFRNVAERYCVFRSDLLGDPAHMLLCDDDRRSPLIEVPNLMGRTLGSAREEVDKKNLKLRCGEGKGYVVWQFPAPDRLVLDGSEVMIAVADGENVSPEMIDLTGLSIRQVSAFLEYCGISYEVRGNGRVVSQSVGAGETILDGSLCRLRCRPI